MLLTEPAEGVCLCCAYSVNGRPFWYLSYVYVRMPAGMKGPHHDSDFDLEGKRNDSLIVFSK